ncbi:MAG: hypothetical protein AB7O32_04480 [Vicinamibacterales bacterium]
MRTFRHLVAAALMFGIATAPALAGERHLVDSTALATAVRAHASAQEQQRSAVLETLSRPEVQGVARSAGFDTTELSDAVKALSPAQLGRVAVSAGAVNDALVGGASTVTISTTTIIIGLLVLILLIVALD